MKRRSKLRCPICRKPVARGAPELPFCSERCRQIDLGKWASGGYVISTPIHQAEETGEGDYAVDSRRFDLSPAQPGSEGTAEKEEEDESGSKRH